MDQFELLYEALGQQREHVVAAVEGLDETQLTTSLVRSKWSPAEVVSHLTFHVERFWFRDVFAGQSVERDDDPKDAWVVAPGPASGTNRRTSTRRCCRDRRHW